MGKDCDTKLRFYDVPSATAAADSYNARIAIKFSTMDVYPCGRHKCLHIGHGKRRTPVKDAADLRSVHRHMLRQSIECDQVALAALEILCSRTQSQVR
jgi:hypothetical protein